MEPNKIAESIKGLKMVDMQHQNQVTLMLKVIFSAPLDIEVKQFMRMRIWGKNPQVFAPMTTYQILFMANGNKPPTKGQIEAWDNLEKAAKAVCMEYLEKVHAQEVIDKFNEDKANKTEIFSKLPSQNKRFSV